MPHGIVSPSSIDHVLSLRVAIIVWHRGVSHLVRLHLHRHSLQWSSSVCTHVHQKQSEKRAHRQMARTGNRVEPRSSDRFLPHLGHVGRKTATFSLFPCCSFHSISPCMHICTCTSNRSRALPVNSSFDDLDYRVTAASEIPLCTCDFAVCLRSVINAFLTK